MPKNIKTKIAYLEILLESPNGVTPSEISDVYFDDVTNEAANNALRRLKKSGCATRIIDQGEYRYWITDRGIRKYDYLRSQEE